MQPTQAHPVRTAMLILTCARCGRSVKVFGKVSRVLCACGQILFHSEPAPSAGARGPTRANPLRVLSNLD
jgi:hypothetical protein